MMNKIIVVLGVIGLFIGVGIAPGIAKNMELFMLDELDQDNSDFSGGAYTHMNSDRSLAQSFKPSLSILTRVELLLWPFPGYDHREIILSIRNDLYGMDLTNVSVNGSNISADPIEWTEFDFPDINVTPEETYYIVCSYDYYPELKIFWFSSYDSYVRGNAWSRLLYSFSNWNELTDAVGQTIDLCFKTYGKNHPPGRPTIQGPAEGTRGMKHYYSFNSIDADGDELHYIIYWGDDTGEETIGPFPSGTPALVEHKWEKGGTYYIEAKAIDPYGIESDWGLLKISMPKPIEFTNPFIRFLENHPNLFPILRQLLGL